MSRFVSAGAGEGAPSEEDSKWLAAQQAIEATRSKPRVQPGSQEGGKSLFETLEANKAAKQDAFEQSMRLGNQFQALDDDDVEFLDSVMESTRAQEAAIKKETREQLEAFRRQQQDAERGTSSMPKDDVAEETAWKVGGRKRKKGREDILGGVKLRKSSSTADDKRARKEEEEAATVTATRTDENAKPLDPKISTENTASGAAERPEPDGKKDESKPVGSESPPQPPPGGLGGLAAYGSSDEDD